MGSWWINLNTFLLFSVDSRWGGKRKSGNRRRRPLNTHTNKQPIPFVNTISIIYCFIRVYIFKYIIRYTLTSFGHSGRRRYIYIYRKTRIETVPICIIAIHVNRTVIGKSFYYSTRCTADPFNILGVLNVKYKWGTKKSPIENILILYRRSWEAVIYSWIP